MLETHTDVAGLSRRPRNFDAWRKNNRNPLPLKASRIILTAIATVSRAK